MSTQTDKSIVWCRNQLTVTAAVEGRGVGSESRAGRDELGFVLVQFEMRVRHLRGKIDRSTFWGWGGLGGTADPRRGFPSQAHLRSRVMAALPVGGGSARARRNELQVPEGCGLAAVFLASVAVFPAAAAAVAPGGGRSGSGSVEAFGVWASATQLFISYNSSGCG